MSFLYLDERCSGDPGIGEGVVPKGGHFKLPDPLGPLSVAPDEVEVVE